jgi:nitroreductase
MRSDAGAATGIVPDPRATDQREESSTLGCRHDASPAASGSPAVTGLPTDLNEVMTARRSVRTYGPTPVSDTVIASLLDLARRAPSSLDGQPWHFIVVRDPVTKARLAGIKNRYCPPAKQWFPADFLADAPAIVLVCVELSRSFGRHIEDGVLAAFSIMLAATRHGLAAVYLSGASPDEPQLADEIRELFAIPERVFPVSLVPLGYPACKPDEKVLRPLREMIHYERFGYPGT